MVYMNSTAIVDSEYTPLLSSNDEQKQIAVGYSCCPCLFARRFRVLVPVSHRHHGVDDEVERG